MTTKDIDGVIDALSRTITELRETKVKLTEAEKTNASNVEIKRNLALRINELQKELAASQQQNASDRQAYQHFISRQIDWQLPPLSFCNRELELSRFKYPTEVYSTYRLYMPASACEVAIDPRQFERMNSHVPFLRDSLSDCAANFYGEQMRKRVRTMLETYPIQEIK